jgi:hypothetical protein
MGFGGLNRPENRVPLAAVFSRCFYHILIIITIIEFVKNKFTEKRFFLSKFETLVLTGAAGKNGAVLPP